MEKITKKITRISFAAIALLAALGVSSRGIQADTSSSISSTNFSITSSADLAITKVVNNATPVDGTRIIYLVTVSDLGPEPSAGVVVQDMLPSGLVFNFANPSQGFYDESNGDWTIGDMAPSSSVELEVGVTVSAIEGDSIINVARVYEANNLTDPDEANNSAAATITVAGGNTSSAAPNGIMTVEILGLPSAKVAALDLTRGIAQTKEVSTQPSLFSIITGDDYSIGVSPVSGYESVISSGCSGVLSDAAGCTISFAPTDVSRLAIAAIANSSVSFPGSSIDYADQASVVDSSSVSLSYAEPTGTSISDSDSIFNGDTVVRADNAPNETLSSTVEAE